MGLAIISVSDVPVRRIYLIFKPSTGTVTERYGTVQNRIIRSEKIRCWYGPPYFAFLQEKRRSWVHFPVSAASFAFSPQFFCLLFLVENAS